MGEGSMTETVTLLVCEERILHASHAESIEIKGMDKSAMPDYRVLILVDGFHFFLEEENIICSGFVRAHLVHDAVGEGYELEYKHVN
jgi:hypothetical protein